LAWMTPGYLVRSFLGRDFVCQPIQKMLHCRGFRSTILQCVTINYMP
jgi:hypothetical protein